MSNKILYLAMMVLISAILAAGCASQAAGVTTARAALPVLDIEIPTAAETASFALG